MSKKAVLLINLGSPDSTSVADVKRYLNEFLMDKRVIDKPYWLRYMLVKGIIVPFRAPKSAEAYQSIWWEEGSPLIVLTERLQQALQEEISYPVIMTMRYGSPHPKKVLDLLLQNNPAIEELILVPLYPHYAMSSYETAVEYVKNIYKKEQYPFSLKVVMPYYKYPSYIEALAESIRPYLQSDFDQILFSYHGVPERHILKGDPTKKHCMQIDNCCYKSSESHATCYRHQVTMTSELVAKKLGLKKTQWRQSFQSRLGRDPWLAPSTQECLELLPKEGKRKILVVCPAFISDCLETLEEIKEEGKKAFIQHGGESYTYIPCLNTNTLWVATLKQLISDDNYLKSI